MIHDGFIFNDELDLLELRLQVLDPVVDRFVLVEMGHNFRMQPKPLHFQENKKRFEPWLDKISTVHLPEYPIEKHPVMEYFQRRQIASGMNMVAPDDYIMIGDVDEIPDPDAVSDLVSVGFQHPYTFIQQLSYYWVNCRVENVAWPGTVILPRGCVPDLDCEDIRQRRHFFPRIAGGWHYSWLGDVGQIANKLRCIDVEGDITLYNSKDMTAPKADDAALIETLRSNCKDLFGRDLPLVCDTIQPGINHPKCIDLWLAKYPHYARVP